MAGKGSAHASRAAGVWLAVVVLWLAFVWGHSLVPGPASTGESNVVMHALRPAFEAAGVTDTYQMTHLIRKCAHFLEYAMLGLLCSGLRTAAQGGFMRASYSVDAKAMRLVKLGTLMCCLAPVADETIQIFTPGRSSLLTDVLLDLSGVLFGTLVMLAARRLRRRRA
ncbi:MAG: VanZ family protein [Parafannyhessea sp.]|uniref:VanZ family protein n=1 Tax=Parafannyhessea sp. TaxID=2847324 RepID=UPI003F0062EC